MRRCISAAALLILGAAWLSQTGCAAFECKRVVVASEREMADGARVVLSEKVSRTLFGKARKEIALSRIPPGEGPACNEDLADGAFHYGYVLRVHPAEPKAWVIAEDSGRVVMSVDFETDRSWSDPDDQPEWATTE